jgi:hypothetical protein
LEPNNGNYFLIVIPYRICKKVEKKYEGKLKDFHKDSFDEYVYNQMRVEIGKPRFFSGPIQCYCEKLQREDSDLLKKIN